jgi:acetyl esterase/lipase
MTPGHLSSLARSTALLLCVTGTAASQDKSTYYTVMHPGEFKINWTAFYDKADELTANARNALPHELDVAYGTDPKQRLDLYLPTATPRNAPVFVFLHGGGFREGDRAHYGFVAAPLAGRGIITVVPGYRLAPQVRYPDPPRDVQDAIAWVYRNIGARGGDPGRIYIGGHSAGGILAADVSLQNDWTARLSLPGDVIKGLVPVSGPYDLRPHPALRDYAPDAAAQEAASPILHVEHAPARAIIAVGSVEPFVEISRELADRIRQKGGQAEVLVLEGLEHDQTALAFADERGNLVQAIVTMISPAGRP